MAVLVEFTKNFAGKVKGDKESYDSMLASQLVHNDKVAKYTEEQIEIFKEIKAVHKKQAKELSDRLDKAKKAEKARIAKVIKTNKKAPKK